MILKLTDEPSIDSKNKHCSFLPTHCPAIWIETISFLYSDFLLQYLQIKALGFYCLTYNTDCVSSYRCRSYEINENNAIWVEVSWSTVCEWMILVVNKIEMFNFGCVSRLILEKDELTNDVFGVWFSFVCCAVNKRSWGKTRNSSDSTFWELAFFFYRKDALQQKSNRECKKAKLVAQKE